MNIESRAIASVEQQGCGDSAHRGWGGEKVRQRKGEDRIMPGIEEERLQRLLMRSMR